MQFQWTDQIHLIAPRFILSGVFNSASQIVCISASVLVYVHIRTHAHTRAHHMGWKILSVHLCHIHKRWHPHTRTHAPLITGCLCGARRYSVKLAQESERASECVHVHLAIRSSSFIGAHQSTTWCTHLRTHATRTYAHSVVHK